MLRVLTLVLCSGLARAASGGEPPVVNGATSPSGRKHPGTILNEDRVHHRTSSQKASDVPQSIAWVEVDGAWRAVVKIVVTGVPELLEITQYGEGGVRLQTTYQAPR